MYFLLGISITLALLLIVNMIAAIFASGIWKIAVSPMRGLSVKTRARIIFALRIGPIAAALVFVLAFVVPAYLIHEPDSSGEVVSGKLALITLISTIGVCVALYRVIRSWIETRRLNANWIKNSVRVDVNGVKVPVYRLSHPYPVMAVVGILRPRIFVAEQVWGTLNDDEFAAAVAHEHGHMNAGDNLKRTLLRGCRDLMMVPVGSGLDRAWAHNAESAADEYAALGGSKRALDMASALLKIARIAPANAVPAMPAGSYLIGKDCGDVTSRVRRLLSLSENAGGSTQPVGLAFSRTLWLWPAGLILLLALHLTDQRLLLSTHDAIERFVWMIQ